MLHAVVKTGEDDEGAALKEGAPDHERATADALNDGDGEEPGGQQRPKRSTKV